MSNMPRSLLRSLLQVQLVDTSSPKSPRGGIRDTLDFSTFPYNTRSNLNSFPAFNSMESNNDTWKCNKLLLFSGGLWFSVMPQWSILRCDVRLRDTWNRTSHCRLTDRALDFFLIILHVNVGLNEIFIFSESLCFPFCLVQCLHYFTNWHCFGDPVAKVKNKIK